MINKSYKIWIILFIIVNLLLLVWSLGYFKFLEEKFAIQDNIIVIEPDNQFKKYFSLLKIRVFPMKKAKYGRLLKIRKIKRKYYKIIKKKKIILKIKAIK